jgi:hypothetical protein
MNEATKEQTVVSQLSEVIELIESGAIADALYLLKDLKMRFEMKDRIGKWGGGDSAA